MPPQGPGAVEKVDVLEVPVIRQVPVSPLVKVKVDEPGVAPQEMVMGPGALIVGSAGGVTVIVLDPLMVRLQASVYVHASVNVPPHPVTVPVLVDITVPEIRQLPEAALLKLTVGTAGMASQATVTLPGGVRNTAGGAGVTVMVLVPLMVLLQASVKVQLSVIVPPQPVTDPVLVAVTAPVIRQVPLPLLE